MAAVGAYIGVSFFRAFGVLLGRLIIATLVAVASVPAIASDAGNGRMEPSRPIAFDLAAQPLDAALETYASLSGRQVVYEGNLATGRWSAAVRGAFTADIALRMLLSGTGLLARYMAADGFVLVPDPAQRGPLVNTASLAVVSEYYARIQAGLRRAFCANDSVRSKGYRVGAAVWVGQSGELMRGVLLDSTGDSNLDATLDRAIHNVVIGGPPPAGFAQPVLLLISSELTRDCLAAPDRQLKAER